MSLQMQIYMSRTCYMADLYLHMLAALFNSLSVAWPLRTECLEVTEVYASADVTRF